jgi:hypothetical protein
MSRITASSSAAELRIARRPWLSSCKWSLRKLAGCSERRPLTNDRPCHECQLQLSN